MSIGAMLTRRNFFLASATAAAGLGWYAWRIEPHWIEVVEHTMPVAHLPSSWQGRRVVQLSDIHVGSQVDPDYLRRVVRGVAELEPDLIVVTGDFSTAPSTPAFDEIARLFAELPEARLGALAVLGNHDWGEYYRNYRGADRLEALLRREGVDTLRNEVRTVDGLQILGLDDFWGLNFDPRRAFKMFDADRPSLILCHNPDVIDLPLLGSYQGWMLSGHTHGGQCKPPFLPPPMLPTKNRRYVAGAYDVAPGRNLYVNRGVGHLIRARFNVRPEVTVHTLVTA